jgi:hypothetical protein
MAAGPIQGGEGERRFSEEVYMPLFTLEHFAYCPRQRALTYVEQIFHESVVTPRGCAVHEHLDWLAK